MEWLNHAPALKERMFALARCPWPGRVRCQAGDTLRLACTPEELTVTAPDLAGLGRGLFQAACALRDGLPVPALEQRRHIASCGMMLDMSLGGVMTV